MVQLLNLPRDKIEAIISLGIFVFLYTLYVEIVYGNTDQSFFCFKDGLYFYQKF